MTDGGSSESVVDQGHVLPPLVILVVGRPASGKTTLAARIVERFALPLLAKDAFKEILFERLGVGDRAWSMRVGQAAFALLDHAIEQQLRSRTPFVVEAPYDPRFENDRFQALQRRFGFRAFQIRCVAPDEVLVQRFVDRSRSRLRHVGHADAGNEDEFRATLGDGRPETLALAGAVVDLDVTDEAATARAMDRIAAELAR